MLFDMLQICIADFASFNAIIAGPGDGDNAHVTLH
jgi:hypothetical protein